MPARTMPGPARALAVPGKPERAPLGEQVPGAPLPQAWQVDTLGAALRRAQARLAVRHLPPVHRRPVPRCWSFSPGRKQGRYDARWSDLLRCDRVLGRGKALQGRRQPGGRCPPLRHVPHLVHDQSRYRTHLDCTISPCSASPLSRVLTTVPHLTASRCSFSSRSGGSELSSSRQ